MAAVVVVGRMVDLPIMDLEVIMEEEHAKAVVITETEAVVAAVARSATCFGAFVVLNGAAVIVKMSMHVVMQLEMLIKEVKWCNLIVGGGGGEMVWRWRPVVYGRFKVLGLSETASWARQKAKKASKTTPTSRGGAGLSRVYICSLLFKTDLESPLLLERWIRGMRTSTSVKPLQ